MRMVYGNFIGREKYQTTSTLDGGKFSGVPWVSGLIEGRGRMYDPKTGHYTDLLLLSLIQYPWDSWAPFTLYRLLSSRCSME